MGRANESTPMEGVAYPHRAGRGDELRRMQSAAQIGVSRPMMTPLASSVRPREHGGQHGGQQARSGFWNTVLDCDRPQPSLISPLHSALGGAGSSSSHMLSSHSFHLGSGPSTGARAMAGRQSLLKRFPCAECNGEVSFASQGELNAHKEKAHRRPRPFPCPLCEVGFSQKSHLNQHIRTVHHKVRPHKCPQCDKAFGKKYDLSSHRDAVHANERPHACELCDKRFAKRSNLTRHREKLHPERAEQKGHR